MTALLVLAIAASSALVFTSRTELLKLAVILALWAAVVAAFISVIYRRQSDVDQAKARDLKLVYDLQLDREIAARREYELEVETQLRRELAAELQAQADDEVAALRSELAALRTNLEILFETDLAHRPALEPDRATARVYSDWERDSERTDPGRVRPRFTASARERDDFAAAEDDRIIDVHEEPAEPEDPLARRPSGLYVPPVYGGAHRLPSEEEGWAAPAPPAPEGRGTAWESTPEHEPPPQPVHRPEPQPEPMFRREPQPAPTEDRWEPVAAEGQWLPPGTPGTNWASSNGYSPSESRSAAARDFTPEPPPPVAAEPRRGRHASAAEPVAGGPPRPEPAPAPTPVDRSDFGVAASGRRARHSSQAEGYGPAASATTFPTPPPPTPPASPPPAPMHPSAESETAQGQHGEGQGQSVADLLARFQQGVPSEGGRRRRRDD